MTLRIVVVLLIAVLTASAQEVGENGSGRRSSLTLKVRSELVIETVSVTDKKGSPVKGLRAEDFIITEDDEIQDISVFEYQNLEGADTTPSPRLPERIAPLSELPRVRIARTAPGNVRHSDHRLLVLYFDMDAIRREDKTRVFEAAGKFVRNRMTKSDLLAVMTYNGGSIHVLQDFTNKRERILSILQTLVMTEFRSFTRDIRAADSGAFGQNNSEFNIFNTDRQLSALQTASRMLGILNEKKALVYFSSGMNLNGMNNQAQLHATINEAIRSGVSFWPVDARGLTAQAPLGGAAYGSPGGTSMYTGAATMALMGNFQRSQDTLWTLAADTGGKALLDCNDLSQGITRAQKALSSYYIIGYYPTNPEPDGKYRRIKVSLKNGSGADLDYRQGYYARKQFGKFTSAEKERQLEEALMLEDPITELTIAVELDYFQLNRAEYFVPLIVKIPGSELVPAGSGGAGHTRLDFIGEIKDEFGTTVSNVRDRVDIKLSGTTAAELEKRPILYDTGFTLLPGRYCLKFLARDAETGRIGTYEMPFEIPNLNRVPNRIPISSVVLSSQRVNLQDALFNASRDSHRIHAVNPLVQEGQKLIPSVTRVFHKSRDMYIYLQAYRQDNEKAGPLVAYATFYRDRTKAFETAPIQFTEALNNRLKTTPLKFELDLQNLLPGSYDCQVTVVDPSDQKAVFWQAPIVLIP